MRIVVTGASGFLGSALIRKLAKEKVEIVGVTRKSGTPYYQVSDYSEAPDGDVLVHLAEDSDRTQTNATGPAGEKAMQVTITKLLQKGYSKTVYASTAVLYGDSHLTARQVGDTLKVVDSYTRIKFASESAVLTAGGVSARIANLYGPHMAKGNVLNRILSQVPGAGDVVVQDSSPVRDFIWVDDAAAALTILITGPVRGLLNIGSGIGVSILRVARTALEWANQGERAITSSHPSSRVSHLVLDITETTKRTAWKPTTTIHQGIGNLLGIRSTQRI